MDYNYHTHTYRCNHAIGTEEEYIQRAIKCGIKYMGFSDHVPLMCEDGFESPHRVPVSKAKEYVETISDLREKYKDKIDIKIGFEVEFYPDCFEDMLEKIKGYGAEYLILGQHFVGNEHYGGKPSISKSDSAEKLMAYCSLVIAAIKTGVFSYVAHPDMVNFIGDDEIYSQEIQRLCEAAKEAKIPLEMNFLGIRDKRIYPNEKFWQIAGKVGAPVTFGFDAHDVESAYDGESLITAKRLVEKYNLNYIGKPNLILLNKI